MTAELPAAGLGEPASPPRTTWVLRSVTAILLAVAVAILLGTLGPYLSPRWKLLLIYPAALAAAAGWISAELFRWGKLRWAAVAVGLAVPIVSLLLATYFTVSLRLHRIDRAKEVELNLKAQPGGVLIWEDLQSGRKPVNEVEAEFLSGYRRVYDARRQEPLDAYLQARLVNVKPGGVSVRWARILTAVECLIAIIVGSVVVGFRVGGSDRRLRRDATDAAGGSPVGTTA